MSDSDTKPPSLLQVKPPSLLEAAQAWVDWYDRIQSDNPGDHMNALREQQHGKRINALRSAIAHAESSSTPLLQLAKAAHAAYCERSRVTPLLSQDVAVADALSCFIAQAELAESLPPVDGGASEVVAELESLMKGFGQSPSTHETFYQHSEDDDYVIASQYEDTDPTILLSIPADDDWREQFANLVFCLWFNRTLLLRLARLGMNSESERVLALVAEVKAARNLLHIDMKENSYNVYFFDGANEYQSKYYNARSRTDSLNALNTKPE